MFQGRHLQCYDNHPLTNIIQENKEVGRKICTRKNLTTITVNLLAITLPGGRAGLVVVYMKMCDFSHMTHQQAESGHVHSPAMNYNNDFNHLNDLGYISLV